MAQGINELQLMGNVGNDPEIKTTSTGTKYARFSLATNDVWKDKTTGERKEHTEWHRLTAWDSTAELIESYIKKGSKLFVKARLRNRKYTDEQGVEKYTIDIVVNNIWMLDSKADTPNNDRVNIDKATIGSSNNSPEEILDDDIPF